MHLASQRTKANGELYYSSSWDCLRRVVREEGARRLYSGLSVNLLRGAGAAFILVAYDEIKEHMK